MLVSMCAPGCVAPPSCDLECFSTLDAPTAYVQSKGLRIAFSVIGLHVPRGLRQCQKVTVPAAVTRLVMECFPEWSGFDLRHLEGCRHVVRQQRVGGKIDEN